MNEIRRQSLQAAGGVGLIAALTALGLFKPELATAQGMTSAVQAKTMAEALKALGVASPAESKDITISSPDIAENGAVVPVGVKSGLPKTEMIALVVEKNPTPFIGAYELLAGAEPEVNSRIKMGQTSDVYALVKADGKFYTAKKEIKITLGGCGG